MGSKRDHAALLSPVDQEAFSGHSNKRRREQPKQPEPNIDPTYGQRVTFPGLDALSDDLEYEDAEEALSYLRSVRQEASDIPNLLVAAKAGPELPPNFHSTDDQRDYDRSIYESGAGDYRGYYGDGAYVAAPNTKSPSDPDGYGNEDWLAEKEQSLITQRVREAYYSSLASQFLALRQLLHTKPPKELVDALPRDHETHVGRLGVRSKVLSLWTKRIRTTDPSPVQIAAMSSSSVLKLLRVVLKGNFINRDHELSERTSRWIWAILAKLPDRGELDCDDISWIRELGKRAVLMMVSMGEMAALREQVEDSLEGGEVEEDGEDGVDLDEGVDGGEEEVREAGEEDGDGDRDEEDGEISEDPPNPPTKPNTPHDELAGTNRATIDDDGEMDMDIDEGEISDDPGTSQDIADVDARKRQLLVHLQNSLGGQGVSDSAAESNKHDEQKEVSDETRARINVSATLNMILTVAGEFYYQRDLLEFRNPFPDL